LTFGTTANRTADVFRAGNQGFKLVSVGAEGCFGSTFFEGFRGAALAGVAFCFSRDWRRAFAVKAASVRVPGIFQFITLANLEGFITGLASQYRLCIAAGLGNGAAEATRVITLGELTRTALGSGGVRTGFEVRQAAG